jgi:hypothetical protein
MDRTSAGEIAHLQTMMPSGRSMSARVAADSVGREERSRRMAPSPEREISAEKKFQPKRADTTRTASALSAARESFTGRNIRTVFVFIGYHF